MQEFCQKRENAGRSALIDCLRGLVVISMVLYHVMWDMVNLFEMHVPWFHETGGFIWQQFTCCSFILLSGFCAAFGKHSFRRGLMILALGAGISAATLLFTPNEVILYGVLTLIGSCMIFTGVMKPYLLRIPAWKGMLFSFALFAFTRNVNGGTIGIFFAEWIELPVSLYRDYITAYFGFPHASFYSTDYFSVIPWIFLFLTGFFLFEICGRRILSVRWKGISVINLIGRHALLIYVLHQPIIYGILCFCKMSM